MSFGFSVGDFVAVSNLIVDITTSLKDVGGAKSEYQGLLRELECLRRALQHLDMLQSRDSSSTSESLASIKHAALSCRFPLEEFLSKIKKYDKYLGVQGKKNDVKGIVKRLEWSFGVGRPDEIAKLQSYLNVHVGTINILLAEYGLEMLDVSGRKAEVGYLRIDERLEVTRKTVEGFRENVAAQTSAVNANNSLLTKLYQMVSGELSCTWTSLANMVAKVWYVQYMEVYLVLSC